MAKKPTTKNVAYTFEIKDLPYILIILILILSLFKHPEADSNPPTGNKNISHIIQHRR